MLDFLQRVQRRLGELRRRRVEWRRFRILANEVSPGMTESEVLNLLGEPDVVDHFDHESDFDRIWTFCRKVDEDADLCLAFLRGKYSHGWSRRYCPEDECE